MTSAFTWMVHPFGIVPSTICRLSVASALGMRLPSTNPARNVEGVPHSAHESSCLVLALGILGEPALPDTLPLLENLQDAPEA